MRAQFERRDTAKPKLKIVMGMHRGTATVSLENQAVVKNTVDILVVEFDKS